MFFLKNGAIYVCISRFSTILNGYVNRNCDKFVNTMQRHEELLLKINNIRQKFAAGGGERARIKHVHQNKKLLVDDKLRVLFDKGKYFELCYFVGYGQSYGDIAKGGGITTIGLINDRLCAVVATDSTVKGGTIYPIQLRKQLRIQQIAMKLRLPFIFVVDSGGAFLPLQAEIFPDKLHGGRIFYNEAIMQSQGIPTISLVCGSCTAGGAYIPNMCTEMGMVNKGAYIFLGGPALVKAATGEIIDAEELGGSLMHARISGCSDHTFESETDGLMKVRYMVSTLPTQSLAHTNMINPVDSLFPLDDLKGLHINYGVNLDERRDILIKILARLLDESFIHEFKAEFGSGLLTGFGRISGCMVGILAGFDNLTEPDCLKGSHFIQLCGHRHIPIVSLVHTVDESLQSPQSEQSRGALIKAKTLFLRTIATRNSKMITVVIGDAIGMDYMCLGAEVMEPDFIFGWPNARFGNCQADLEDIESSSILKAAGNMIIDEIIDPEQTRMVVTNYLRILQTDTNLPTEMKNSAVYRF